MRRKIGELVPLEKAIMEFARQRSEPFYGYDIAGEILKFGGKLTDNGTLYRALARLEKFGLLTSHWEKMTTNTPPRKYYEVKPDSTIKSN